MVHPGAGGGRRVCAALAPLPSSPPALSIVVTAPIAFAIPEGNMFIKEPNGAMEAA